MYPIKEYILKVKNFDGHWKTVQRYRPDEKAAAYKRLNELLITSTKSYRMHQVFDFDAKEMK